MTSLERLAIEIVAALCLVGGFTFYERHKGAQACVQADTTAFQKQEFDNAVKAAVDAKEINDESKVFAQAVAAPTLPAPTLQCVRILTPRSPVLPAAAAGRVRDEGAHVPAAADRSVQPGTDIAKPAAAIGQACDAQLLEAQAYIRDVVRPKGN